MQECCHSSNDLWISAQSVSTILGASAEPCVHSTVERIFLTVGLGHHSHSHNKKEASISRAPEGGDCMHYDKNRDDL